MTYNQQNSSEPAVTSIPLDLASQFFQSPAFEVSSNRWPADSTTMVIRPITQQLPEAILRPLLLKHQHIEALSYKYNLPLCFMGVAPVFEETRLYQGQDSKWVLSPVENDVLYQHYGNKLPMPKAAKMEIDRVVRAGIDLRAYIGHELPAGVADAWESGQRIPLEWVLPPVPRALAQRTQALAKAGTLLWRTVQATVKTAATVGLAATSAVVVVGTAVAAAPLALAAGLDPVILGCCYDDSYTVNGRPVGLWFSVCQWYWPEE
jgi:hypothetical protein